MALTPTVMREPVLLNFEQHPWATSDLIRKAEELADAVLDNPSEDIFFIPLEEVNREGLYFLRSTESRLFCNPVFRFPGLDKAFGFFIEKIQFSSAEERELRIACITYALAHGMDIVRRRGQGGISLLTGYAHSTLYDDTYDYEE